MDKFVKLPRWAQWLSVLVVCGLFFAVMWLTLLSSQRDKIKSQTRDRDNLASEILRGKEAQARVAELNRQLDGIRRDLEVLKSIIPVNPETGQLLRVFQSFARDQNLGIVKINPSQITKQDLYSEQIYKIEVTGDYNNLALFFDKIAHMRRIVNINNLKMSASRGGRGTIKADFSSLVYMQNPDAFKGLEEGP